MSNDLTATPIIVLCGGLGTRLRSVMADKPKVLAPIGDKALLDIIISMLVEAGFKDIILSVGYERKQIKEYVKKCNYDVIFSEEEEQLGTGGAVKAALSLIGNAKRFFVMNGDMLFKPNFLELQRHHAHNGSMMTMALTRRYLGSGGHVVETDSTNRVVGWRKRNDEDNVAKLDLNAGTYIFEARVSQLFPETNKFSLEDDLFPVLFNETCHALVSREAFIDIGIPERYEIALQMAKKKSL